MEMVVFTKITMTMANTAPFSENNYLIRLTKFCHIRLTPHHTTMKPVLWLPSSCALFLLLNSCADKTPDVGPGTGPYDSAGNYREDWADDPSKWRKPGSRSQQPADDLPMIAKNEQPPADSNPLAPQVSASPKPAVTKVQPAPRETTRPTETAKRTEEPKVVATKPKPKPKPAVVKAKPKPKPKPKTTRYIVKSGDSLSRIAARNGSSVSAIQKANSISGTLIRPGQSLVIPKR